MSPGDAHLVVFLVLLAVYGGAVFGAFTSSMYLGRWLSAMVAAFLAAPLALLPVGVLVEGRDFHALIDPRIQSWAALFGDILFLPFMAVMLALGWRQLRRPRTELQVWPKPKPWYARWWWPLSMAILGLLSGATFHWIDAPNYAQAAVTSPSKIIHDGVSYPVLFGGLNYALWPVLINKRTRRWALLALIGFALWLLAAIADNTLHQLDPRNLHPMWDWERMETIPYP